MGDFQVSRWHSWPFMSVPSSAPPRVVLLWVCCAPGLVPAKRDGRPTGLTRQLRIVGAVFGPLPGADPGSWPAVAATNQCPMALMPKSWKAAGLARVRHEPANVRNMKLLIQQSHVSHGLSKPLCRIRLHDTHGRLPTVAAEADWQNQRVFRSTLQKNTVAYYHHERLEQAHGVAASCFTGHGLRSPLGGLPAAARSTPSPAAGHDGGSGGRFRPQSNATQPCLPPAAHGVVTPNAGGIRPSDAATTKESAGWEVLWAGRDVGGALAALSRSPRLSDSSGRHGGRGGGSTGAVRQDDRWWSRRR